MGSYRHPWAVMGSHRLPLAATIHCCVSDSKRVFLMAQKVFLGLSSAKVSKTAIPVCDKTLLVCTYIHTHIYVGILCFESEVFDFLFSNFSFKID